MENEEKNIVDEILIEVGIGKFQVLNYLFMCWFIIFIRGSSTSYVFAARDISYRCFVPECESNITTFDQPWLTDAIPYKDGTPDKCKRFAVQFESTVRKPNDIHCSTLFNKNKTVSCESWVYGEGHTTVREFDTPCEEWRLGLVGTLNNVGQIASLIFSGILADKYGRRNVMVLMVTLIGVFGLIQSLSNGFVMYVIFEFLNMAAGAAGYNIIYTMAVEILSSIHRPYGSIVMETSNTLGLLVLPFLAWCTENWRQLLLSMNIPAFVSILYIFVMPESVRWLYAKGENKKCADILNKTASMNNVNFSQLSLVELDKMSSGIFDKSTLNNELITESEVKIGDFLKSCTLVTRLLIMSYMFFAIVLLYNGLSIFSVNVSNDENGSILNFTVSSLVEFIAIFIFAIVLHFCGRKYSIFFAMLVGSLSCFLYAGTHNISTALRICSFLLGKIFATMSLMLWYIYSSEMFPTGLRNSCMNIGSICGRLGGAVASFTPVLVQVHPSLPMLIFGIVGISSLLMIYKLPETRGIKLPDTLEEAKNLK